ncbi:MAG: hypothetical protein IBX68_10135 [Dehalococcoidia bacterium]|nr:hypothetical protein [Dehalococcoidia bacterium]
MKVTLSEIEETNDTVWEGEALKALWDRETGELVIRGKNDTKALAGIISDIVERRKLIVEIEDTGPGRLIWRGYVGSAEFLSFEMENVECCLIMLLDDWFGIVPQFSQS